MLLLVPSLREYCPEDLDGVASKDCCSAELLGNAEDEDDEERFVDFRVLLNVLHIVHLVHDVRLLLLEAESDLLHLRQGVETGFVDLHQRSFCLHLFSDRDQMNRRFWGSEEQEKCKEGN